MEFADGSSLENIRLEHPEIISTKFLLDIALQLAAAMDYACENFAMTHGDIKPGNMLIRNNDHQLKICDLGLARSGNSNENDSPDDVMVTPLYAAPEIIRQEKHQPDPRSDIYSFGVVLYELCCGAAPFQGTLEEILEGHLHQEPEPLLRQNPDMDREMAEFIGKMLQKSPDDRPASWKEVRSVLGAIRKRLYPAVAPALSISGNSSTDAPQTGMGNSSWSHEFAEKPGYFARHPQALPTILIAIIALAIAAIIIQLL
jgi:serine/threonine protein kinase